MFHRNFIKTSFISTNFINDDIQLMCIDFVGSPLKYRLIVCYAAIIHRCFISRNTGNLIRAFKTYVRPMLEYASQTWSPYLTHQYDLIESVQRSFTKRLPGFNNLSYTERLAKLNLQSLEQRRLLADLKMCYNIVHGLTCLNFDDFFVFSQYLSTRGHRFKLIVPISRSNIRKYFFASRVVPIWNSLPEKLVTACSPHVFKKLLSGYDFSVFLRYPCIVSP